MPRFVPDFHETTSGLPERVFESVPSFVPEVVDKLSGGNFEELFHSEYTEFVEAQPIIDTISPSCPTNLTCVVNTAKRKMFFTWYWPITYSADKSVQNDIKEFEFLRFKDDQFIVVERVKVPRYEFFVSDDLLQESFDSGLMFAVRAIDFHDLFSDISKIILVKLNKNYSCKNQEIKPVYVSKNCGIDQSKKYILNNKIIIEDKEQINFSIGAHIGIKEPFINKKNTLIIKIKELNSDETFYINLNIQHSKIDTNFSNVSTVKTSDIVALINAGRR